MTKQQRAKEEENELHFNILRGVKNGKEYRPRLNFRKRTSVDELAYILWAILSLFFLSILASFFLYYTQWLYSLWVALRKCWFMFS
jgi:hypothetical protein